MTEHTKQAALAALQRATAAWFNRGYADAISGQPRPVPRGYNAGYSNGYGAGYSAGKADIDREQKEHTS